MGPNSIFDFENEFNINSPLKKWISEREFKDDTNTSLLLRILKKGYAERNDSKMSNLVMFHYEDYKNSSSENVTNVFLGEKIEGKEEERDINIKILMNTHADYVDFKKLPSFKLEFDNYVEKLKIIFRYEYSDAPSGYARPEDRYLFLIELGSYRDFVLLLNYLGYSLTEQNQSIFRTEFNYAFNTIAADANKIDWLYEHTPDFVLADRDDKLLWDDMALLSKKSINSQGTDENLAILNLLGAIKDAEWFCKNANLYPDVIREIVDRTDKAYFDRLLIALTKLGASFWDNKTYSKAPSYQLEQEVFSVGINGETTEITGYCVYDKDRQLYDIGNIVFVYEKASPVPSERHVEPLGFFAGFDPVHIPIESEEPLYLPAFIVEYYHKIKSGKDLETLINNALIGTLPELLIAKAARIQKASGAKATRAARMVDKISRLCKKINIRFGDNTIRQSVSNVDDLYKAARKANKELGRLTEQLAAKTKGKARFRPKNVNKGLKDKTRVLEKISEYPDKDPARITDIAGSKILYDSLEELHSALDKIRKEVDLWRIKDRVSAPVPSGFRDILMNIRMSNGHIVELRLGLKTFDKIADIEHNTYKIIRTIKAKAASAGRGLSKQEIATVDNLLSKFKTDYAKAWDELLK